MIVGAARVRVAVVPRTGLGVELAGVATVGAVFVNAVTEKVVVFRSALL